MRVRLSGIVSRRTRNEIVKLVQAENDKAQYIEDRVTIPQYVGRIITEYVKSKKE